MKKISWALTILLLVLLFMETGCKQAVNYSALNLANLDTTAVPGNDFYRFATGGWQAANPLPDEYSRYGSFDQLGENNQVQVKSLIEELGETTHEQGSVAQKIGDLFRMGMDSVRLNADGASPILAQIEEVKKTASREALITLMASRWKEGVNPFMGLYIGADDKNSSMNILHASQGGLNLGDRDYYLNQDEASRNIRKGYAQLIQKQFVNAGFSPEEAQKASSAVLRIETSLAVAHYPKEKTRIPELNYHKMSVATLNDSLTTFGWSAFFAGLGIDGLDSLDVAQPEAITAAIDVINQAPLEDLKAYYLWNVISSASGYLSDDFVTANFDFYGKQMSGALSQRPRWKRTLSTVEGALGEAVGQMYVQKYFPASSKKRMLKLVDNLKKSLSERIANLEWMSDETKANAQDKLNAFTVKIGYPDKWRDYSALNIKEDSYYANILRSNVFDYNYQLNKLGKPVDKDEWLMNPQMVNAYYNPTTNEICFPAGILQPPFFYADGDDAINYGAIGVVIGHEMTHGFDDQGSKYDKVGNMVNWWTESDATQFNERTQVLVNHFNNIIVLGNLHANGSYTLGENIADHGGLQVAFNAFKKTKEGKTTKPIEGYTPQQRFFLSYANVWAGNIRDEEIIRRTKLDPHSLGEWRVNGSLPHINAWYEAFHVTEKDALYLPVEKRASIW